MQALELQLGRCQSHLQEFIERVNTSLGAFLFDSQQAVRKAFLLARRLQFTVHRVEFDVSSGGIQSHLLTRIFQAEFSRVNASARGANVLVLRQTEYERLHGSVQNRWHPPGKPHSRKCGKP